MADKSELSPAEEAANEAHTATRADEQGWASKIEERLVALEDKAGITKANEKADTAEKKED